MVWRRYAGNLRIVAAKDEAQREAHQSQNTENDGKLQAAWR